jgi:cephalosporin-C deacetylase-like acetyl esterase
MRSAVVFVLLLVAASLPAAEPEKSSGERMFTEYFRQRTEALRDASLAEFQTADDWNAKQVETRRRLFEMLGLDPLPPKRDLQPVVTGTVEKDDFVVEKLHFQSLPGLYVTANLYRPKEVKEPLPAILYVCGHGAVKKGNVSFGNKVHYQHHGAWFARNGYVCLTIDSLQLGEIEGIHHGTYRYDMWWWLNRGYTPAGVEAWNCIRALDYLETRPEVDKTRLGVTGRSGGGAYSWWIAALDDRIACAVPGAGVTDLENHVIDGCVEGHCDCMYFHNAYQWDYPEMCALVAPRPLLISNTDTDPIFPLDGVYRTFEKVRRVYRLLGVGPKCGLSIAPGPHVDSQELQVDAFRWFNHHLKTDDRPITIAAEKFFEPEQLRVFGDTLPNDQINTKIQESFVPLAQPAKTPDSTAAWQLQRDGWLSELKARTFRAWPEAAETPQLKTLSDETSDGLRWRSFAFASQGPITLQLYVVHRAGLEKPELTVLNALDDQGWQRLLATYGGTFAKSFAGEELPEADADALAGEKKMFASFPWAMAYVAPRGAGPTSFDGDAKKRVQYRRRLQLLGETLEGGQVYDVRRAVQAVKTVAGLGESKLWLQGNRQMAGVALYASLFEPGIARLDLHELPATHRDGPYLWNVQRVLDMPQAVALAADRAQVVLYTADEKAWDFPLSVAQALSGDKKRLQIRKPVEK